MLNINIENNKLPTFFAINIHFQGRVCYNYLTNLKVEG